jgi:hypothetical protein
MWRRLEDLEAGVSAQSPGSEEARKAVRQRIGMAVMEEAGNLRAPRFRRAKDPADRTLPPEAEELWGEDFTVGQVYELAIERVFDRLEEVLATPSGVTGDLRPYVSPEDLTSEGKARLAASHTEAWRKRLEEHGSGWDEPYRKKGR